MSDQDLGLLNAVALI